jgi:hypothetical protein
MQKTIADIFSLFAGAVLVTGLLAPAASGRPEAERPDLRESCRQAVAGEYISAYDGVKAGRTTLVQVDDMRSRVQKALKDAETELAALRSKVERVSYDVALSDRLIQQGEKVKALASTLAIYQEQADTARAKLVIIENREAILRKSIESVFAIVRGRDSDKNYPLEVRFRADCPKFRFMCPLPLSFHPALTAIALRPEGEEACSRYLNYSLSGVR